MAYIHVFDCNLDFEVNKKKIFENIKMYAQTLEKEFDANTENENKKPLQFFVANKYPFYIDKENLSNNIEQKNFLTSIDENIEKIKRYFNENSKLIKSRYYFFPIILKYKLFIKSLLTFILFFEISILLKLY